jgi:hypothetical protein
MFMVVGMGLREWNVAMVTEAAIAPTLTVKVVFTNLQFIILPFSLSSPSSVLLYHLSAIP